jgi:hypothetical protein
MLETNITDTELLDNFRFELQYFIGLILSTFIAKLDPTIPFEINYAQMIISDLAFFLRLQKVLITQGHVEFQFENDQGQKAIIVSLDQPIEANHSRLLHSVIVHHIKLVYHAYHSPDKLGELTSLYVHLPELTNDYQTFLMKLEIKYGISYELVKKLKFQPRHYIQGSTMFLQLYVLTETTSKISLIISSQRYVSLSQLN